MNKIEAKVYYIISTGEILLITSEMYGDTIKTTKEQDMISYPQLKDKKIDDVDFIELKYGSVVSTFCNTKSRKVNVETKELELTYYSKEELFTINEKNKANVSLNSRVSDITQYLNNNEEITSTIEDLIIQTEQNKILKSEGMI